MMTPTLPALIDSGSKGLLVRNPDSGLVFRVVYANWKGVLPGVRIFMPGARAAHRSPIMHDQEIVQWLAGLCMVRDAAGRYWMDHGVSEVEIRRPGHIAGIPIEEGEADTVFAAYMASDSRRSVPLGFLAIDKLTREITAVCTLKAADRRRGIASVLLTVAAEALGVLRHTGNLSPDGIELMDALNITGPTTHGVDGGMLPGFEPLQSGRHCADQKQFQPAA